MKLPKSLNQPSSPQKQRQPPPIQQAIIPFLTTFPTMDIMGHVSIK